MMNKKIDKHLKNAIDDMPIDLLDKIKEEPVKKMEEHDYITRQEEIKPRTSYIKPVITLASAFAIFIIAYFGWYTPYIITDSIVYFDINPSIEMSVNSKEQVIHLEGLNEEGKKLIDNIDYKRRDMDSVIIELFNILLEQGYIDEEHHAMLISVLNDDIEKGNIKVNNLNEVINEFFEEKDIKPLVLRQSVVTTNTIEDFAEKYNTSVGKMTFIKNLIILNPEFALEELVSLSIEELIMISRDNGLDLDKIVEVDKNLLEDEFDDAENEESFYDNHEYNDVDDDTNEDIDQIDDYDEDIIDDDRDDISEKNNSDDSAKKEIISSEKAKAIALKLASGEITDFELEEDDGRLIYEIEIESKYEEHEIEIDAYTGKIIEHEIDYDDDDDDD